ncbi:GTPase-activating protein [Pichia kluyveri]|uniref:GTPase-activating protein n=1 Tax=Pichia kluyveri TaxID=36015 RepID=A0AAV5R957_PICKL|nr:GTPase-activating protein [Pichia kluyveri]
MGGNSKDCKSCHLRIEEGQSYKLGSDHWHVECFKCSKCSKILGVDSNFLVLGTGALVCSDCSYTCKSCEKKIYDLAILTGDLAYCADCFKCKACKKPIDDLKYARTSKGLFCIPCHNMLIEKKKKYEKMKKLKEKAKEKSSLSQEPINSSNEDTRKDENNHKHKHKHNHIHDLNHNQVNETRPTSKRVESESSIGTQNQTKRITGDDDTFEMKIGLKSKPSSSVSESRLSQLIGMNPPKMTSNVESSSVNSKSSFQANVSSTSTFDLDMYADTSKDSQNKSEIMNPHENGSSVYSSNNDKNSIQLSADDLITNNSLEKVDSSPIEKLDVRMEYQLKSPKTLNLEQTPTFNDYNANIELDNKSTPKKLNSIPILTPQDDSAGFAYLHDENNGSDMMIPMRSPRRAALSPVRNTAQFRTPELDTPRKKSIPENLLSPASDHRKAYILDDDKYEKEPESFINLNETEEESLMSKETNDNLFDDIKGENLANKENENIGLMSPIKYKVESANPVTQNAGLNISGLDPKLNFDSTPAEHLNNTPINNDIDTTPKDPKDITHTPEDAQNATFDNFDKNATPNSKRKQIGGLGRSLTKVFGRGRKMSNDFTNNDQLATPETITSRKSSIITSTNTPKKHTRTQSDHSFISFNTPQMPHTKSHNRSISESTTFDIVENVASTDRETRSLKTEINALTHSKATLLRDIQSLKDKLKSLEREVNDKQRVIKDLDLTIINKQKIITNDNLSISNNSTNSAKTSLKEEYYQINNNSTGNVNIKYPSTESIIPEEYSIPSQPSTQPTSLSATAPAQPMATSASSTNSFYQQPGSSASQTKDKRSGFMRRIFGSHSALNSAGSVQSNGSPANSKPSSATNISQPMNMRRNDEFADSNNEVFENGQPDVNGSNVNKLDVTTGGMKASRSANFMQWRNTNNNNNTNNNSNGNSNVNNSLYNMSLQELSTVEAGTGVPFIMKICMFEIEKRGIKSEGIYRISASTSTVEKFEQIFENINVNNVNEIGKLRESVENIDINAMAGLLKRYLKKIPDSIIPQDFYDSFVGIYKVDDEKERLLQLNEIISSLPRANKVTLYALTKHLALISDNEKWNKMNSSSLATVFAPTLIRHNSLHPQQEIQDNKAKTAITELLFKNYSSIFSR